MTPVQKAGIKEGVIYTATSPERANIHGRTFVLDHDDGSTFPYFREVLANGTKSGSRVCIDVTGESSDGERLDEVNPTAATPLKNFIIEVTDVETTVRVGKLLSADQLKRIIEILGE